MPASYREAEWPERGQPGYPRMQLENRCYCSRVFRRLHMELVHRQDSIQARASQPHEPCLIGGSPDARPVFALSHAVWDSALQPLCGVS